MNDANQMREAGAEEEGCEISILLEETPQEHPHTQEVTADKKKVSSPNVTADPCKEKQENAEIVKVVPDHEKDTAYDIVTDEDEINAPGTRASDCTNILEISKKEHEPSTRKGETPVGNEQHQTGITKEENKKDGVSTVEDKDMTNNESMDTHAIEHVEEAATSERGCEKYVQLVATPDSEQYSSVENSEIPENTAGKDNTEDITGREKNQQYVGNIHC